MTSSGKKSSYVLKLISELSQAIAASPYPLTAQGIGNSLYGTCVYRTMCVSNHDIYVVCLAKLNSMY